MNDESIEFMISSLLSPYFTICANNEYYLVCRDENDDQLKHFRIDKLKDIVISNIESSPLDYGFSISEYTNKYIYQNGESPKIHTVICKEDEIDSLIDYFGDNISFTKKNNDIEAKIKATNSQFRIWSAMRYM